MKVGAMMMILSSKHLASSKVPGFQWFLFPPMKTVKKT